MDSRRNRGRKFKLHGFWDRGPPHISFLAKRETTSVRVRRSFLFVCTTQVRCSGGQWYCLAPADLERCSVRFADQALIGSLFWTRNTTAREHFLLVAFSIMPTPRCHYINLGIITVCKSPLGLARIALVDQARPSSRRITPKHSSSFRLDRPSCCGHLADAEGLPSSGSTITQRPGRIQGDRGGRARRGRGLLDKDAG